MRKNKKQNVFFAIEELIESCKKLIELIEWISQFQLLHDCCLVLNLKKSQHLKKRIANVTKKFFNSVFIQNISLKFSQK